MQFLRFSIAGLMGSVLIAAVGLVALRFASPTWAGATLLATCSVLALAVVGVVCRGGAERAWWLGCVLFGWGYMALAFWSPVGAGNLPTVAALEFLWSKLGMTVPTVARPLPLTGVAHDSFAKIGHCFCALVGASLGGILASAFFAIPTLRRERHGSESRRVDHTPPREWQRPAILGLSGIAAASVTAVACSRLAPSLWAGISFLLSCGLLGMVALGALIGPRRSREIWLGAALFGWGYMILAFGWHPFHEACPYLVTGRLLDMIRPSFPPEVGGFPPCDNRTEPDNSRILKLLEQRCRSGFRRQRHWKSCSGTSRKRRLRSTAKASRFSSIRSPCKKRRRV